MWSFTSSRFLFTWKNSSQYPPSSSSSCSKRAGKDSTWTVCLLVNILELKAKFPQDNTQVQHFVNSFIFAKSLLQNLALGPNFNWLGAKLLSPFYNCRWRQLLAACVRLGPLTFDDFVRQGLQKDLHSPQPLAC